MNRLSARDIPNPKTKDILPPDMDYIYFEKGNKVPFKDKEKDFSPVNTWWMAECAFLSYCHPGFAKMAFQLAGYKEFKFFQGVGTECMVAWNRKRSIVAFRGTEVKSRSGLYEAFTDLNTIPTPFEEGGKVHRGFLNALDEVWPGDDGLGQFLKKLQEDAPRRPMWITGHSLGGALASLCFTRIKTARGLYLFGSPRIGDEDYIKLTKDKSIWRVEHDLDPVPLVPPDMPSLGFNFKDQGQLVAISKTGDITFERKETSLIESRARAKEISLIHKQRKKSLKEKLKEKALSMKNIKDSIEEIGDHLEKAHDEWKEHLHNLYDDHGLRVDDHMPIFYCTKLWNHIIRSRE